MELSTFITIVTTLIPYALLAIFLMVLVLLVRIIKR